MFCKVCGSVIPMGITICPYCKSNPLGNEINNNSSLTNGMQELPNNYDKMNYSDQKRNNSEKSGIGLVLVITILGIVAAFVIIKTLSN